MQPGRNVLVMTFYNLVGQKFSRLTVIRRATEEEYPRGNGRPAMWYCQCDCGNFTFAAGSPLRKGIRVSCGCLSKEKAVDLAKKLGEKNRPNLIGQTFGWLTVKELASTNPTKWLCKCKCGAYTEVQTSNLKNEHTTSCGCKVRMNNQPSSGEEKILGILKSNNILFQREKTFTDLVGVNGFRLRFDFAVYNQDKTLSFLIEVQGLQHYQHVQYFQKTRQDFLKQQENDRRKISYCLAHKIDLYLIPYWELKKINSFEDILQDKFKAKSKWHNDYLTPEVP